MTVDQVTEQRNEVVATPAAVALLTELSEWNGALLIHQAGGICAGSDPMCHPVGDFRLGQHDVPLGEIPLPEPLPAVAVWIEQGPTREPFVLDVARGRGSGFSLEAPAGVRFVIR